MAKYSQQFETLFQAAANEGLEFEVLEDLVNQALNQIDWEYAGQQIEKSPIEELSRKPKSYYNHRLTKAIKRTMGRG